MFEIHIGTLKMQGLGGVVGSKLGGKFKGVY